jgi:hypothetical protein
VGACPRGGGGTRGRGGDWYSTQKEDMENRVAHCRVAVDEKCMQMHVI